MHGFLEHRAERAEGVGDAVEYENTGDSAYVSARLGHANPATTLRIYAHQVPGTRRVSIAVLDTASANNR